MLKRTTFLISALCLLILANVLMMSYASPAFMARGEGFVGHMDKKAQGFKSKTQGFKNMHKKENFTCGSKKEKFTNYSGSPGGARDTYQPMGAFDGVRLQTGNNISSWRYTAPNEPLLGNFPKFEPGQDNLFMFKDNQCKPECCPSSFSCDGGCVCTSPEQRDMINGRGGNRSSLDSGV